MLLFSSVSLRVEKGGKRRPSFLLYLSLAEPPPTASTGEFSELEAYAGFEVSHANDDEAVVLAGAPLQFPLPASTQRIFR